MHITTKKRSPLVSNTAQTACAAALALCLAGCVTVQLQEYSSLAATFQKTFSNASTTLSAEYTALSAIQRQEYLDDAAYNKDIKIGTTQGGVPTPLLQSTFSPAAFKARADALTAIGTFAQRIVDLAGNSGGQTLSSDITGLGTSITNLSTTFGTLSKSGDTTAEKYIGPVTSLVADITNLYTEKTEAENLKKAVDDGAPDIFTILNLFDKDMQTIVGPENVLATHDYLNNRLVYYNGLPAGTSLADRKAALDDIDTATTAYVAAQSFNPTQAIQALYGSLQKLQAYADDPKGPKTFADVIASLQAADQSLQDVSQQVATLQKLIDTKS